MWTYERIRDEVQKLSKVMGTKKPGPLICARDARGLLFRMGEDWQKSLMPDDVRAILESMVQSELDNNPAGSNDWVNAQLVRAWMEDYRGTMYAEPCDTIQAKEML